MSRLTLVAAAGLALTASPCLAFTFMPAPVSNSGRSALAAPDAAHAAMASSASSMREAFMRNNGGFATGGTVQVLNAPISFGGAAAGIEATSQVTLVNGPGFVPLAAWPAAMPQVRLGHR
jgi:hypothetical protein